MQDQFSEKMMPTKINLPGELAPQLNFFIKREDLHVLGSHKHFATEIQIKKLARCSQKGVISTSGNAGISAGHYAKKHNVEVYVLTSDNCETAKLEALAKECNHLFLSKIPARIGNYIAAKYGLKNLRPSMDDLAVEGFENLGNEIFEQFLELKMNGKIGEFWEEIFTFVTSGASYIGIFHAFKRLQEQGMIKTIPKLHCVTGFAGQLGTKYSARQKEIDQILKETNGKNIEISENMLNEFKEKFPNINLSGESLSSIVAAMQSGADESSLIISTGKKWKSQNAEFDKSKLPRLDNFEDCDKLFS